MAFGFAGAAQGSSDALQRLLQQEFLRQQAAQEMALRQQAGDRAQQELMLQAENQRADQEYRTGQVERQGRLDREAVNQKGVSRMMGDFLMQRGSTPLDDAARNQLSGMALSEGIDLPRGLAESPPPKQPEPFTLSPGSKRFDAAGKEVASVAPTPPQPRDERLVQVMDPSGKPVWVRESQAVGKPAAQAARAVTGQERQALAYYNRAKDAVDTITGKSAGKASLEERMGSQGLAGQGQLQYAPNFMQSSDQQAYRQAQRAFTEARLRKESGAAIPNAEYENDAKTYFVQPGDGPELVEQKRKARQTVLEGLKFGSGRAYEEFYGPDAQAQPAGSKTISRAQIQAIAAKKGITPQQVEAAAVQQGYTVQ